MRCANDTLYTGITTDLARRLRQHNSGKGAAYTRSFGPVTVMWSETRPTKGDALRRESEIKKLSRAEKLALAGGN